MKLAMKLRTRLFLSISALITVALLGLLLGLVSVMQMAKTQESLIRSNFITLDLGLKYRCAGRFQATLFRAAAARHRTRKKGCGNQRFHPGQDRLPEFSRGIRSKGECSGAVA
jgi:hypothetical protein